MFKKGVALLLAIFFTFGVVASASDDIFPPLFEFWKEDSTVTIIVEVEGEPSGAKNFLQEDILHARLSLLFHTSRRRLFL